ncbi:MAG: alcohol dehydrogenase catalytic domain-containing protein [Christensenellaceae bacterium]
MTLASICERPPYRAAACRRAVPGVTVGHEMVGVESVGARVKRKTGDRVTVNVTFCSSSVFCRRGTVNNCTHRTAAGRWAAGLTAGRRNTCAFLCRHRLNAFPIR